jgi:predicted Zn-dependent peptidase
MKCFCGIMIYVCLVLAPFAKIRAQDSSTEYQVIKASNGQTFLFNTSGSTGTVYTDIYFRIGPIYEYDSVSGITMALSKVINAHINAELKASGKSVQYSGTVEPEQIGFHFESDVADIGYVLALANDKIMQMKLGGKDLKEAKTEIRKDLDSLKKVDPYTAEGRIWMKIWGNDYKKLNPYGDRQTYTRLKDTDLVDFQKRYFLPSNNTVCIIGGGLKKKGLNNLPDAFKEFRSRDFNPELIDKVIDFKQMINTVQFVSTGPDKNMATITYQNPGARQDRYASYCANILVRLINDQGGRMQKYLTGAGLKTPRASYQYNNFYGTFTISAQLSGHNFLDAFSRMGRLFTDIEKKDYFIPEEIEKAKKDILAEYNDMKTNDMRGYMSLVARYRFSSDENYFAGLPDSIKGVTVEQMRRYINDYFTDRSGVRNLVTSAAAQRNAPENQQYVAVDESVADIKFVYELNKTDIETGEAKQDLKKLIQWLIINPDMHVQVNGFSDQGEYTKAYDSTVMRFIDTTATFHKAMPDVIRKGYLRIEMMRAMKIVKALYEAGISSDRITGTSMVFTSDTKEAAAANRKCTLTMEKIRPHASLYEYHFGRKKPELEVGER